MTVYIKRVIFYLRKKGVSVEHLYFYPKDSRSLPYSIQFYKGFVSFQSIIRFWNAVKKQNSVCINYPNVEAIPLILCALLQRKKIITIYHCSVHIPNPFLALFIAPFLFISLMIHLSASTSIISQEDYILSQWWSFLFKNKYVFIDPPIDIPKPNTRSIKKITNSIGFIGRISSEKGVEYLIEAMEQLKPMHLYLIGPSDVQGENEYRKKIMKLIKQKKIPYSIITNPTDAQLSDYLCSLEMIVIPSINQTEAYGMVQPEAMWRGTAVIATDLPGVRTPIQKTNMGIIVPPKNIQSLKDAILTIHNNIDTYTNQKNREKAQKIFNPTKTLEIIYNTLITS
jgi:glycosyltransferase involved in cell wall biosynthesis